MRSLGQVTDLLAGMKVSHPKEARVWEVRRLVPADAQAYQKLRIEGFIRQPLEFRVAPEDESDLSLEAVGERLRETFVAGGFDDEGLAGLPVSLESAEGSSGTRRCSGGCTCTSGPEGWVWQTG